MFVREGQARVKVEEVERVSAAKFGDVTNFYEMKVEH